MLARDVAADAAPESEEAHLEEARIKGTTRCDRIAFEVQDEPDDIELVVELRNAPGRAWVQQDSLKVGRLKP